MAFIKFVKNLPYLGVLLVRVKHKILFKRTIDCWLNNTLINKGSLINVNFHIDGEGHTVHIGEGFVLKDTLVYLKGKKNTIYLEGRGYMHGGELWIEDEGGTISIGAGTTIEQAHLAATEGTSIIIGKDCMLAKQVEIRTGDSHSLLDEASQKRINPAANVILRDHVWLGNRCTLLKGTTVGKNAVVAGSAVITGPVPEGTVVAGVPAKVIKTGITWDRRRL